MRLYIQKSWCTKVNVLFITLVMKDKYSYLPLSIEVAILLMLVSTSWRFFSIGWQLQHSFKEYGFGLDIIEWIKSPNIATAIMTLQFEALISVSWSLQVDNTLAIQWHRRSHQVCNLEHCLENKRPPDKLRM